MWTAHTETVNPHTTKARISDSAGELSFLSVIALWSGDASFREYFTSLLCDSSFEAFFWETPSVTVASTRPFEFVLVGSSSLARLQPDPAPFRQHFAANPSDPVLKFPNLGGDAILIVPAPRAEPSSYTHFARFLRLAPRPQVDEFWRITGLAMQERLSPRPVWLSTAGMGVSWLHLRLDSRPKYYRYDPYKASE